MRCSSNSSKQHAKVIISVVTFCRLEMLNLLLRSLRAVAVPPSHADVAVLIVDNDVNETARPACDEANIPFPLQYIVEPRRGIAQARNAAVRHAFTSGADFIAFVDDDETVEPQWLSHLLRTQEEFEAQMVAAPVVPKPNARTPPWIIQGGFRNRPRYSTGQVAKTAGTGNVLIALDVFSKVGTFDERFAFTGGEDTEFFLRASRMGFKIIWCDEAVAYEDVSSDHSGLYYLLRREYHDASLISRIELTSRSGVLTSASRAGKGALHVIRGALTLPVSLLRGLPATARALMRISLGAGMLGGLLGITFERHRRVVSV